MTINNKSGNVPELRFPEFQGKWVSERMGTIYSFKGNNSLSREKLNYDYGFVKNVHYGDIHTKYSSLFDITKEVVPFINPSESLDAFREENYCVEGDMIFADASEDLQDIGKCIEILNLNNEKLLSGTHTILARQVRDSLIVGFGAYLFKSATIRAQIQKEAQGTKVLGLSANRLSNIDIVFPTNKIEQQKIAGCLSSLDNVISLQKQKIDSLQQYKKGLMQNLFPAKDETMPELRFSEFMHDAEWKKVKLGGLVSIQSGVTPSKHKLSNCGRYAFLKVEDLNNCNKYQINSRTYTNSTLNVTPKKSIIFPKRGAAIQLNKVRINVNDVCMDTNLMAVTPNKNTSVEYLYYKILSDGLYKIADTSTIPQINNKHIIPYPIIIPVKVEEQQKIADCLSSLDELITNETQKLAALKMHKIGLMRQLFPSMDEVNA